MTTPHDHIPDDLPLDLELERQRLHTRVAEAQKAGADLPETFRVELRNWTDRVLQTIGWIRRDVYCPTCQRRLDTQDTWTFTYERQLPTFVYPCQQCAQEVEQTFTRLQ